MITKEDLWDAHKEIEESIHKYKDMMPVYKNLFDLVNNELQHQFEKLEELIEVPQILRDIGMSVEDAKELLELAKRLKRKPKGIEHYLTSEEIKMAEEAFKKGITGEVIS